MEVERGVGSLEFSLVVEVLPDLIAGAYTHLIRPIIPGNLVVSTYVK